MYIDIDTSSPNISKTQKKSKMETGRHGRESMWDLASLPAKKKWRGHN